VRYCGAVQQAVHPPSTGSDRPVMKLDRSDTKKSITSAISSARPMRLIISSGSRGHFCPNFAKRATRLDCEHLVPRWHGRRAGNGGLLRIQSCGIRFDPQFGLRTCSTRHPCECGLPGSNQHSDAARFSHEHQRADGATRSHVTNLLCTQSDW